jgi:hypothetical protein
MFRDLSSQHQGAPNYINQLFNLTVSCMWQKYRKFINMQCICDITYLLTYLLHAAESFLRS